MKTYKNGNTLVAISEQDGTKIRYIPDGQTPKPVRPESIDIKITNRCLIDPPCQMCHEMSGREGRHANLNHPLLDSIEPYTELAIGGGDPFQHPDLEQFLTRMKEQKVFCNLTVHWCTFLAEFSRLQQWVSEGLVHGLGISINEVVPCETIDKIQEFPTAVVHCVLGMADEAVYRQIEDRGFNVLLLGYKTFGRGAMYRSEHVDAISANIDYVKHNLEEMVQGFKTVCFDNLAIEQLEVKKRLNSESFDQIYMGSDGAFTMYIDLVKEQYAVSSTSKRYDIFSDDIKELFADVRKKAGHAT